MIRDKNSVSQYIMAEKIVAVVRAGNSAKALKIIDACVSGGVKAVEVTFTVPFAHKVIEDVVRRYDSSPDVVIGAGTVLDSETARIAMLSGAAFVVSPSFSKDVMKICNRYAVLAIPGVITVAEAVTALEYGAEILKIFPGELHGTKIIKAFSGPLPQAKFMPTGGVRLENVSEWLDAGACAVGVGSVLTKGAKDGNYGLIEKTAQAFCKVAAAYRGKI